MNFTHEVSELADEAADGAADDGPLAEGADPIDEAADEIGRASCRERVLLMV